MDALFTLVRQLATRSPVTEIAAPKWLVQRHGLAPMLARTGIALYRDDLVRATVEWARIERDLPPVVHAIRRAGLRVAPIKGVAYATALYATPAERPMADVDLLVPPADLAGAERVLVRLGFDRALSPRIHHAQAWVRTDFVIDLHHSIISPGRSAIDLSAVWERAGAGWPPGAEQLEATDALLFHLINLARNRLHGPLIQVVDAARLLAGSANEQIALARARTWNLGAAVAIALRFCRSILAGDHRRPAGWLGPSGREIAFLVEPRPTKKVLFDLAIAGSARQFAARAIHYGANRFRG